MFMMIVIMICKLKIDGRGRLTLPDSFLKANKIKKNSLKINPIYQQTMEDISIKLCEKTSELKLPNI